MKKVKQKTGKVNTTPLKEIRQAFADYIDTEGCSCCRDIEGHKEAMSRLGKLLKMRQHPDKSGWDYSKYKTK